MNAKKTHSCASCSFTWTHGRDGSHSCTVTLHARISHIVRLMGLEPGSYGGVAEMLEAAERRAVELNPSQQQRG